MPLAPGCRTSMRVASRPGQRRCHSHVHGIREAPCGLAHGAAEAGLGRRRPVQQFNVQRQRATRRVGRGSYAIQAAKALGRIRRRWPRRVDSRAAWSISREAGRRRCAAPAPGHKPVAAAGNRRAGSTGLALVNGPASVMARLPQAQTGEGDGYKAP